MCFALHCYELWMANEPKDVKNAFLHEDLEDEVYMKLPLVHPQSLDSSLVSQLNKSIYGLKQSPSDRHAKLSIILQEVGFLSSNADYSLFVNHVSNETVVVLVYIDDLIIDGNINHAISQLTHFAVSFSYQRT